MPLIIESPGSLPYIDARVSEQERTNILRAIAAELPSGYQTTMHPSLPPLPQPKFTATMQAEIGRKAKGEPTKGGIDMSRYEAQDEPTDRDESKWQETLETIHRSSSYLESRQDNLSLLEEYGKNAWLVGNSQLEDMLRQPEKELGNLKDDTETINKARKAAQEESQGELMALEGSWRTGVGKIIEVQIASNGLREDILKRRRIH